MYKTITDSMRHNKEVTVAGHTGKVRGVMMEDGSGNCFNVTMLLTQDYRQTPLAKAGETITFFVRVRD